MPPKGWRKNAEGAYPATSKERDQISIDDILFPKATVTRLARAILPDGAIISKDSATALQRSSSLFVSYLLVHARTNAKKFDRKTIGPQDIIAALQSSEFSSFIPSVKHELDAFQTQKDAIKQRKKEEKIKNTATTNPSTTSTVTEVSEDIPDVSNTGEQGTISTGGNETVNDNDDNNDNDNASNENGQDDDEEPNQNQEEEPQSKKLKITDAKQ